MKSLTVKSMAFAGIFASVMMGTGTSIAGPWQCRHPRRAEVNRRFASQYRRIGAGVRDSQLNPAEARQLHTEDRSILRQEDLYARYDDGHISRAEQGVLNTEENHVSRQIYDDRHDGGQ